MNIRAIIFDFDGTMCNTNQLILDSWQHTYRTIWGREEEPRHQQVLSGQVQHAGLGGADKEHGQRPAEKGQIGRAHV